MLLDVLKSTTPRHKASMAPSLSLLKWIQAMLTYQMPLTIVYQIDSFQLALMTLGCLNYLQLPSPKSEEIR